uniref:Type II toxin-antitoxin system HicA family toxin n=1 Tax=Fundidesulfovibrio putealis TaxID=270496 RepID=A0A7C4EJV4_9BACT
MSTTDKMIAKMRLNPRDWRIESLQAIAKRYGLKERNPDGSHVIFSFPGVLGEASVPNHRPIKPIYIKKFLALLDAALTKEE